MNKRIIGCCFCICLCAGFLSLSQVWAAQTATKLEKDDMANSWRYENGKMKENQRNAKSFTRAVSKIIAPGNATAHGVDVSKHNGTIDWQKAKNSLQVDYAILRAGYGGNYTSQDDVQWERNVAECEKYEIPYGAYLYSYADTVAKAKSEADHMIRLLKGKNLSYPVYYDMEDDNTQGKVSNALRGEIATAFLTRMEDAGYTNLGVYANKYWFTEKLTADVFSRYPRWVAQYNTSCDYKSSYHMWQYSEYGSIPGIDGYVDLNYKIGSWNAGLASPRIRLGKSSVTITNGSSYTLSKKIIEDNGTQKISWSTSKSSVVTVSSSGTLTGKYPGSTTVTAKLTNGNSQKCVVKIRPKTNRIKSLRKSGSKSIKITWTKVAGASTYQVYMSTKKNSGYKRIKTTSYKTASYTKGKLKKKKRYYFKVRSYKTTGSGKIYSSLSSVKSIRR